jgi:transposase InsO family protein
MAEVLRILAKSESYQLRYDGGKQQVPRAVLLRLRGRGGSLQSLQFHSRRDRRLRNLAIDKDVVRRILAHHHWPGQSPGGPSWLTFLGPMKESLWSMDRSRGESVTLRTHWVLVVMDQYTRRIMGFGVHAGTVDGVALCRMFNRAIRGQRWLPTYLSSDHDPLYKFHQWQANLRTLEVTEIKTVPYVPLSHPFVETWKGSLAPFDANIWITCCSGRVQIWRINCSISGPALTTIAPITHGKGERRICPCHHPSPIWARFAGNHTVGG